ncbi:Lysine--tRNA ligase [uncultured Pleomorphomonas sp.]|uniref:Lysine--tRNA ligase n=1 Tax=uncultured Pleomorphomonas sp. TaxID=442121 RepID=A0A212LI84_9HYPH|nr:lysine--tRNA ligase [uncultured Pleomorphomonas sp.]SCM77220.1 Lysine--tRNA ligase [uncultured Pleomorphomonas sp.]
MATVSSTLLSDPALLAAAGRSKAWPFEEAKKIVARIEKRKDASKPVIFETGYGPSGLPHIGTFGEVARTTMVRHAFRVLTGDSVPTRLLCFSDDMDGMRKVPDNVPNPELLRANLGKALTNVPNPFDNGYPSFGHNNNAKLRQFLDTFGFDYEFMSATEEYRKGTFDETLLRMLAKYDAVMEIMLPTLREERRKTYSPFLPVHPKTEVVMQVPVEERNVEKGTIVWTDPDTGERFETLVTGGHAKCQWKPDWALRWAALGVDYEMSGKDHIDNVKTSSKICKVLGGTPPDGFNYELFLDENGEKISKSKGNGLTIDEWLTYASPDSLALYMFQKPKTAKRLFFDVIPRAVDEYFAYLDKYPTMDLDQRLTNPVWHIHSGNVPVTPMPVSFSMLLNLVSASHAHDKSALWAYIGRHTPGVTPDTHPKLDELCGYALAYYQDRVKPFVTFRTPDDEERQALAKLRDALDALPVTTAGEAIQDTVLAVGRSFPRFQDPSKKSPDGGPGVSLEWFATLYQVLLGQEKGPRFGSFVELYGLKETVAMIDAALAGTLGQA